MPPWPAVRIQRFSALPRPSLRGAGTRWVRRSIVIGVSWLSRARLGPYTWGMAKLSLLLVLLPVWAAALEAPALLSVTAVDETTAVLRWRSNDTLSQGFRIER